MEVFKLDKLFSPTVRIIGCLVIVIGLIAVFVYLLFGLLCILIGSFLCFTDNSIEIKAKEKKTRLSINLFGILNLGIWMPMKDEMSVGIYFSNKENGDMYTNINSKEIWLYKKDKSFARLKEIGETGNVKKELSKMSKLLNVEITQRTNCFLPNDK